jgi:hypothetical protein
MMDADRDYSISFRKGIVMLKILMNAKLASAALPTVIFVGIGLSPVFAHASAIGLPADSDPGADNGMIILPAGNGFGPPDSVPPGNPPINTPAFYNGLANTPTMMPASVPSDTLPGSGFGRAVIPVPASV